MDSKVCVDFHVHSNMSDGTLSPTEVVKLAKEAGLTAIALTDHDTIDGVSEAIEAGEKYGVKVVPGIEISAEYKGGDLHISPRLPEKWESLKFAFINKGVNLKISVYKDKFEVIADKNIEIFVDKKKVSIEAEKPYTFDLNIGE